MFRGGQTADTKTKNKRQDQSDRSLIRVRWGSVLQTSPFRQKGRNNRNPKIQKIIQIYACEASKKLEKQRGIDSTKKREDRERNGRGDKKGQWVR